MEPDDWDPASWAEFMRALRAIELLLPQVEVYILNTDSLPASHALGLVRQVRSHADAACAAAEGCSE